MTHTPGPWFYGQSPNQRENHPGQRSIGLGPEEDGSIFGYRLNSDNEDGAYMSLSGYCTEADACLIAAAPDLLEALSEILRPYGMADLAVSENAHRPRGDELLSTLRKARAAIAKATGATA